MRAARNIFGLQEGLSLLEHWAVGFTVTLKREDKAGVTPKFDYLKTDVFGIGVTGEASIDGVRSLTTKRNDCTKEPRESQLPASQSRYIDRSLGLNGSNRRSASGARGWRRGHRRRADDLGYHIDFSFKYAAGVTPSWIFVNVTGCGGSERARPLKQPIRWRSPSSTTVRSGHKRCVWSTAQGDGNSCEAPAVVVAHPLRSPVRWLEEAELCAG
jgi:hypothetical protein